jgi:hypothetical protein
MVWGIIQLAKIYSNNDVNDACAISIETHSYSYRAVKRVLESTSLPIKHKEKRDHAFTRSMNEYTSYINSKGIQNDRNYPPRAAPEPAPINGRAGATHHAHRDEEERAN